MARATSAADDARRRSLPIRGTITVTLAVLANVLIVLGAHQLALAPGFQPLTVPHVAVFSALGAVGATVVYRLLARYGSRRDRLFVWVAAVVLLLSFLPDIGLLAANPDATIPGVLLLMAMHVVVAVVAVAVLVDWRR